MSLFFLYNPKAIEWTGDGPYGSSHGDPWKKKLRKRSEDEDDLSNPYDKEIEASEIPAPVVVTPLVSEHQKLSNVISSQLAAQKQAQQQAQKAAEFEARQVKIDAANRLKAKQAKINEENRRIAYEARLKAEKDAYEARLAEERARIRAEQARIAAEHARMLAEQARLAAEKAARELEAEEQEVMRIALNLLH